MKLEPWKVLERRQILKDQWIDVVADRVQTQRGVMDSFYLLRPKNWSLVVAVNEQGEFILVRQYRHGLGKIIWEFPAGAVDPDENSLEAAQRELLEETGYTGGEWQVLGDWPCNPANLTNTFTVLLAVGVKLTSQQDLDLHENIEVEVFSKRELIELIAQREFNNPFHLLAYHLIRERLNEW